MRATATPMRLSPAERIQFFFSPPIPIQPGPFFSTLHLLRREAQDCLIGTVVRESQVLDRRRKPHRLFATAMVLFAGIDLLSTFHSGAAGQVGERFVAFTGRYFRHEGRKFRKPEARALYYGYRNALVHSFHVWSRPNKKHRWSGGRHQLTHRESRTRLVWKITPTKWLLNIDALYAQFLSAASALESDIRSDPEQRRKFLLMFRRYGWIETRMI